jgi:predicted AAA+ superfamily ATPase
MIPRHAMARALRRLAWSPAVLLLGPRQIGKTTLAREVARAVPGAEWLDLERASDRARLAEPELFLSRLRDRLVVIDEVQFRPDLFEHLRPEIDADRRPGRFLLLGSASGDLLRQRSESLAGRVGTVELGPLTAAELASPGAPASLHGLSGLSGLQTLWHRGGFPESLLAGDDALSLAWRQDFIQTLLQRDLRNLGVNVAAEALHRFWRMLAHLQGQLFNASQLALSLGGASHATAGRYLDTLVDALLVRRLEPWLGNLGKRLVKSPKVYVRDSGLLHALLGIADQNALPGHPICGASWEGLVVEHTAAALPPGAALNFYRTAAGTELDLVFELGGRRVGVEAKFSAAPKVSRGFWLALEDLGVDRAYVVAPVHGAWPLASNVEVLGPAALHRALQQALPASGP